MIDSNTTALASEHLTELGFALACVASLWHRHWGYAIFSALGIVESHQGLRYPFHGWVRDALLGNPPSDAEKHLLQSTFIYVAALAGIAGLLVLTPVLLRASAGRRLMIAGAAVVGALLAIELISQHQLDAALYHSLGPFTRAAVIYFVGAAAIACGAMLAPPRKRRVARGSAPHDLEADA